MWQTILGGMILGLILSVTLGPAFFTIIQTSIDRGFKSAMQISIGVVFSDIVLIFISYFGLTTILSTGYNDIYVGIIGSVILIVFGIYTFMKKPDMLIRRSINIKTPQTRPGLFTFMGKGFLLNFLNPFVWFFWLAASSSLKPSNQAEIDAYTVTFFTFFSGTVVMVFAMDLLKSYIGAKIKKYLKLRTQYRINRVVGISLVIFGIILIIRIFL